MSFAVVDLDDPGEIRAKASDVRSKLNDAADAMQVVRKGWSPIQDQYAAPEAPTVSGAMDAPHKIVGDFDDAGDKIKSALDDYASDLDGLKERRKALIDKINDYKAMDPDDDDESGQEDKDKLRKEIVTEAISLAQDKDDIQNRCRDRLLAVSIDENDASDAKDKAPRAKEGAGGGKTSITGTFAKGLVDDVLGRNGLAGPGGHILQGLAVSVSTFEKSIILASAKYTTIQPRNNWLPSGLQRIAMSGPIGARVIRGLTGWEESLLVSVKKGSNRTSFMTSEHPGNYTRSPANFKDGVRIFTARTVAQLGDVNNRKANPNQSATKKKLQVASKWGGRVAIPVAAGTSLATSWQEDSKKYPSMGNGEKATRAAATTATTVGGALAGAKGGAAVGAAVGTFFGPGIGTAAGAIVGGAVGGAAGGLAGGWVGDKAKDGVSWVKNRL